MIKKINCIKNYRIFSDFTWPGDLAEFKKYNLIYGWNGSGKTTLSSIFKDIQERNNKIEGSFELEIDDRKINSSNLINEQLPTIRVFNREFIYSAVYKSENPLKPIFYIGENSTQKEKVIIAKEEELKIKKDNKDKIQSAINHASNTIDKLKIDSAASLKKRLMVSKIPKYINYDKSKFQTTLEQLTDDTIITALLDETKQTDLAQSIASPKKEQINKIIYEIQDINNLYSKINNLISQTVVSEVIDELKNNPIVAKWIGQGLELHAKNDFCKFCNNEIKEERLTKLNAHFNDAYSKFQSEIQQAKVEIETIRNTFNNLNFPEPVYFYDSLQIKYKETKMKAEESIKILIDFFNNLIEILNQKFEAPFNIITLETALPSFSMPDSTRLASVVNEINNTIAEHNIFSSDFTNTIKLACEQLEKCYAAEKYVEYQQLTSEINITNDELKLLQEDISKIQLNIKELKLLIQEHQKPAKELNQELQSYLGHNELEFEVADNGYTLKRQGHPCYNLSEGEKTAIALLYFLKSLQDKNIKIDETIVVIDDPISSLDSSALYAASGRIQARCKKVKQLFVLTHNFSFFKIVKGWFEYLNKNYKPNNNTISDPEINFFQIITESKDNKRIAKLTNLDPLLKDYKTEYHYLFKQLYQAANDNQNNKSFEHYYTIPNMARKFLETFLSFRYPNIPGGLSPQINAISDFDIGVKNRIYNYINTFSHLDEIIDTEPDLSLLSETPNILKELLKLIKHEDEAHYKRMINLSQ